MPGHVVEDQYEGMSDEDRAFMEEVNDKNEREEDALAEANREAETEAERRFDEDDRHDED